MNCCGVAQVTHEPAYLLGRLCRDPTSSDTGQLPPVLEASSGHSSSVSVWQPVQLCSSSSIMRQGMQAAVLVKQVAAGGWLRELQVCSVAASCDAFNNTVHSCHHS